MACGIFRRCAQKQEKAFGLEKTIFQAVFCETKFAKSGKAKDTQMQKILLINFLIKIASIGVRMQKLWLF